MPFSLLLLHHFFIKDVCFLRVYTFQCFQDLRLSLFTDFIEWNRSFYRRYFTFFIIEDNDILSIYRFNLRLCIKCRLGSILQLYLFPRKLLYRFLQLGGQFLVNLNLLVNYLLLPLRSLGSCRNRSCHGH